MTDLESKLDDDILGDTPKLIIDLSKFAPLLLSSVIVTPQEQAKRSFTLSHPMVF